MGDGDEDKVAAEGVLGAEALEEVDVVPDSINLVLDLSLGQHHERKLLLHQVVVGGLEPDYDFRLANLQVIFEHIPLLFFH